MKTILFIGLDADAYGSHTSENEANEIRETLRGVGGIMDWEIRYGIMGENHMKINEYEDEQDAPDFVYEMAMCGSSVDEILQRLKK